MPRAPYIVVWMDYKERDHYVVHESRKDAQLHYAKLIKSDDVETASIARPIESTDYDVIRGGR